MLNEKQQWVATSGLILNDQGNFLVVRRAAHDSHPNIWELPGGAIDHGEHPKEGMKREIKEETGLDVMVKYPLAASYVYSTKDPYLQVIRLAYLCELEDSNQDVLLSEEHSSYQWISNIDEIEGKVSDFLQEIMEEVEKYDLIKR